MSNTKPGYKTTEFWGTTVAEISGILLASGAITNSTVLQIIGAISTLVSALGYTIVRGHVKATTIKSAALGEIAKLGKQG